MADGTRARAKVTFTTDTSEIAVMNSLRRVVVDDHDRLIDEARVVIDDGFSVAARGIANGQPVVVELGWGEEFHAIFAGTVVEIEGSTEQGVTNTTTTVVAHDPSAALHNNSSPIAAQDGEKLSELVERVMGAYPDIPKGEIECNPDPTFSEPNLPRSLGRTHFQFLQECAATWGCRFFVELNDDRTQYYFKTIDSLWAAEPMGSLQMCRGWGEITSFRYERIAARAARQLVSSSVDPRSGEPVRAHSGPQSVEADRTGPVSDSVATAEPGIAAAAETATAGASSAPAPNPTATVHGAGSDPDRVNSQVINDPTQVSGLRGEARTMGHVDIRAKGRVTLSGIAPWAEGDWWVKRVRHIFDQNREYRDGESSRLVATYECALEVTR